MEEQEKIVSISNSECKDILKCLKNYKGILDASFIKTKRSKPFQSVILAKLAEECNEVKKVITNLENIK